MFDNQFSHRNLSKSKLLFLDYDGPLHPYEVDIVRKKGAVLTTKGHSLFENVPILEEIVNKYPDLEIVLSTSWVRVMGFSKAKRRLSEALKSKVIGATWHSSLKSFVESEPYSSGYGLDYFSRITRFQQIYRFVINHRVNSWVALDDDDYGWDSDLLDNLVKCDSMTGLSDLKCQQDLMNKLELLFNKA